MSSSSTSTNNLLLALTAATREQGKSKVSPASDESADAEDLLRALNLVNLCGSRTGNGSSSTEELLRALSMKSSQKFSKKQAALTTEGTTGDVARIIFVQQLIKDLTQGIGFKTPGDVALTDDGSEDASKSLAPPRYSVKPVSAFYLQKYFARQVIPPACSSSEDEGMVVVGDVAKPSFDDQEYAPEPMEDPRESTPPELERMDEGPSEQFPDGWGA
jgi:hypothetical protein